MSLGSRAEVEMAGFRGFEKVSDLRKTRLSVVPASPGVYVFLRECAEPPRFLVKSTGGWFKGRDPSVDAALLKAAWCDRSPVVYIGKASGQTLRKRLTQYLDFGAGRPVGHWGGRYVWHLADAADLVVAWKVTAAEKAGMLESTLIDAFVRAHGKRPFANRVSPVSANAGRRP